MVQDSGLVSVFWIWLSSFPTQFVEETFLSPLYVFWFLCHKLVTHIRVGLALGSQFYSIGLCDCFSVSIIFFIIIITVAL